MNKRFWYVIKDWTGNDFTDEFETPKRHRRFADHETVAEELAFENYWDDPSDPSKFERIIGVKDEAGTIKWFDCTAEAKVDFYVQERNGDK